MAKYLCKAESYENGEGQGEVKTLFIEANLPPNHVAEFLSENVGKEIAQYIKVPYEFEMEKAIYYNECKIQSSMYIFIFSAWDDYETKSIKIENVSDRSYININELAGVSETIPEHIMI